MPRAATARRVPPWLLARLRCAQDGCGGALGRRGDAALRCRGCGLLYPVLGGVPCVVPEPHAYCARYRESIATALAEVELLDRATLATIDAFAAAAGAADVEPMRFGDDWTRGGALDRWPAGFRALVVDAGRLEDRVAALAPARTGVTLELGCGDGALAALLAPRARRLVVADLSLRAVLRARVAAGAACAGCVLDGDALALAPAAFDTIACVNLIDLLERPLALPAALARALVPRGHLVLCTPDPELGGDDTGPLLAALRRARLTIEHAMDQVPWIRSHPPRHAQLYVCLLLLARARATPATRSRSSSAARASRPTA